MRANFDLVPVEVELRLVPGLPQIQILGLPDSALKESAVRIRSAIRAQQFTLPKASRILVDLKPHHLRKSSRGLDLAIAAAILLETKQIPAAPESAHYCYYGELGLDGRVFAPDDLFDLNPEIVPPTIVSGQAPFSPVALRSILSLRDLGSLPTNFAQEPASQFLPERPRINNINLSRAAARLLEITATGEHHTLLGGPPGTGKSTWAQQVCSVLSSPEQKLFNEILRLERWMAKSPAEQSQAGRWRPMAAPHHTESVTTVLGGSPSGKPGLVSQAHGGVLLLDELLEFKREIIEALRGPIEKGFILRGRPGQGQSFPAEFLLIATTNLCYCGLFVPGEPTSCTCRRYRRDEYLSRLNGPVLDRFEIIAFSHTWQSSTEGVPLARILERVMGAREFALTGRGQSAPNSKLDESWLGSLDALTREHLLPVHRSRRRALACARVARTVADLDGSTVIRPWHWQEAYELALNPFAQLDQRG